MPSELVVVAVGAGCAALGGIASRLIGSAVERRRALRDAGVTEVAARRRVENYETINELVGLLVQANHQVAWVSRADGDQSNGRIQAGRTYVARARKLARERVVVLEPGAIDVVLSATDTANVLFAAVSAQRPAEEIAALRAQWQEQVVGVANTLGETTSSSIATAMERAWVAGSALRPPRAT